MSNQSKVLTRKKQLLGNTGGIHCGLLSRTRESDCSSARGTHLEQAAVGLDFPHLSLG